MIGLSAHAAHALKSLSGSPQIEFGDLVSPVVADGHKVAAAKDVDESRRKGIVPDPGVIRLVIMGLGCELPAALRQPDRENELAVDVIDPGPEGIPGITFYRSGEARDQRRRR
jgi:hypothetical protein